MVVQRDGCSRGADRGRDTQVAIPGRWIPMKLTDHSWTSCDPLSR